MANYSAPDCRARANPNARKVAPCVVMATIGPRVIKDVEPREPKRTAHRRGQLAKFFALYAFVGKAGAQAEREHKERHPEGVRVTGAHGGESRAGIKLVRAALRRPDAPGMARREGKQ